MQLLADLHERSLSFFRPNNLSGTAVGAAVLAAEVTSTLIPLIMKLTEANDVPTILAILLMPNDGLIMDPFSSIARKQISMIIDILYFELDLPKNIVDTISTRFSELYKFCRSWSIVIVTHATTLFTVVALLQVSTLNVSLFFTNMEAADLGLDIKIPEFPREIFKPLIGIPDRYRDRSAESISPSSLARSCLFLCTLLLLDQMICHAYSFHVSQSYNVSSS